MGRSIHIFKSFEEQEMFYLEHFFQLTPSERLQALARLQKKNNKDFTKKPVKKSLSESTLYMDIENPEFLLFLKCAQENNLRYLCIGGYAVNYYGFHRTTDDMDIWIAPTNENKSFFRNTLRCMQYSEQEIEPIKDEDFSTYFMCSLGSRPHVIDIITIIHKNVDFNKAEESAVIHKMENKIEIKLVPYDFLKDIKVHSRREKDMWDIAKPEQLRNLKNR